MNRDELRDRAVKRIKLCDWRTTDEELADVVLADLWPEIERLRSWAGLMETLDEHYPAEVFDGSSGDPGPQIVALTREVDRLRRLILDIDAHATPYGDIPDEPDYVGVYLVTAGALHRALGKIGHTAPKCEAEAERDRLRARLTGVSIHAERLLTWCKDPRATATIAGSIVGDLLAAIHDQPPAGEGKDLPSGGGSS